MPQLRLKLRCLTRILSTTSIIVATFATTQGAHAMDFHRNGNKIYASGPFGLGDDVKLERMLDGATKAGIVIDTVVFRVSPGGAAIAGTNIGKLIRERRLNTAVQGGCYSACTASFVGGVGRHDAVDNLPLLHPDFERTIFGIHGKAGGAEDEYFYDVIEHIVFADQSDIVDHYRILLDQEIPVEAMDRIDYAITHLKDSQGFLRYFANDPAKTTTFCPSGDDAAADCIAYSGATIRSDGIVTAAKLDLSDDYLWVRNVVSGNINPNFHRFHVHSETDEAPPLENAYGVIRVADGGVWRMTEQTGADIIAAERGGTIIVEPGTSAPAQLIQEYVTVDTGFFPYNFPTFWAASPRAVIVTAVDGGKIDLRGGTLVSDMITTIRNGGSLSGHGAIASNLNAGAGSNFIPNGIRVQPFELLYQQDRASPSRVNIDGRDVQLTLAKDSNTIFNISAADTVSKIRLIEAETLAARSEAGGHDYVPQVHHGRLVIAPGAVATVNVNPGFFKAGRRVNLVDVERIDGSAFGDPDTTDFRTNRGSIAKAGHKPIIEGAFTTIRRDANDVGVAFSDGAIFHPRENSLLSFTVHEIKQDKEVIETIIEPEFEYEYFGVKYIYPARMKKESVTNIYPEIYMTANRAFDDVALFGSRRSGDGLGNVLLKASDQDKSGLAPLLATLQFANRDIARQEAGSLRGDGHASLRLASGNFAHLFTSSLQAQVGAMRRLQGESVALGEVHDDDGAAPTTKTGVRYWTAGFGQTGKLARQNGIDGMDQDSYGTLFGTSLQVAKNLDIGAAFGFGRMDGRERPGSGIDSRVKAIGGSIYGDLSYRIGYVSAQAGLHRFKNRTDRSILGIEGLEGNNRGAYSANVSTAAIEHGIVVDLGANTRLTAIIPAIEYARLSGTDFVETGSLAALVGRSDAYKSLRLGAGLELSENVTTARGQRFSPYARVMYKNELGDRQAAFANGFAGDPSLTFSSDSRVLKHGFLETAAGIRSPANQAFTVSLDYQGQANRSFHNHSVKIGLNVRF